MESDVESGAIERDPWNEERGNQIEPSTEKREMMKGERSVRKWATNTMERIALKTPFQHRHRTPFQSHVISIVEEFLIINEPNNCVYWDNSG